MQLGKNTLQVSFRDHGYASRERASNFSNLYPDEVAPKNGFRYVMIIESKKYQKLGRTQHRQLHTPRVMPTFPENTPIVM